MEALVGLIFILVFFGVLVALPIYAIVVARKGEVLGFDASAPPDEILMTTVGQVGIARGWATASQSDKNVALTYVRSPNILIAFLLFISCFGLLFAVAYWAIASKKESLNISVSEGKTGKTRVQIVSNGWKGKRAGHAIRDALGVGPQVVQPGGVAPGAAAFPSTALPQPPQLTSQSQHAETPELSAPSTPAGWFDDPSSEELQRFWNGTRWTEDVRPR